MLEEAAKRGTAAVARRGGVGPSALEMIEEPGDGVGVEILQHKRGDLAAASPGNELKQQLERVAIGARRMWARAALARQIAGEERLHQSEQQLRSGLAHRGCRAWRICCSKRVLASSRSCGVAFR